MKFEINKIAEIPKDVILKSGEKNIKKLL